VGRLLDETTAGPELFRALHAVRRAIRGAKPAVTELIAAGTAGALVSIGGDIAAAGLSPHPEGWHVNVQDPFDPRSPALSLAVSDGGIATSSTQSRRWLQSGSEQHHIIDPVTGATSLTDLATVTVIANSGWLAEAHATAAILLGCAGASSYLEARGLSGGVIDRAGQITTTTTTTHDVAAKSGVVS
jgi:thiamine biosynthesis lipoprotein